LGHSGHAFTTRAESEANESTSEGAMGSQAERRDVNVESNPLQEVDDSEAKRQQQGNEMQA
jgi:hypothetical protein